MTKRMRIQILLAIGLSLLTACAAKQEFKDEFDSEKKWTEQLAQLPPYPEADNLITFDVGPISDYQHAIDATSINIGKDGVIRFTLITQSSSGAMNISFEGIRCATSERKLYAIGRDDKTWSEPRISEWQPLGFVRQFYAQRELTKNIFCPNGQLVSNREKAISALKKGIHPAIFR
ncbi:CNP1-like family protein [Nitrosomonas aestuarii]|uniref:CNP1-like family protein n=1 Tax=Nitrosomonas aestuarii TaxID=52441 RepID=UPI000D468D68|nr:CNP1-like family protein [Nitrosomonas aestuarii]PTN11000.1 CNP1-like family protein [Nitrosomonas aestuarii]